MNLGISVALTHLSSQADPAGLLTYESQPLTFGGAPLVYNG